MTKNEAYRLALGIITLMGTACASHYQLSRSVDAEALSDRELASFDLTAAKVLAGDAQKSWIRRFEKKSLEQALVKYEVISKVNKDDIETRVFLARGYGLLGEYHLADKADRRLAFQTGIMWGERALRLNNATMPASVKDLTDLEASISVIGRDRLDALYWTAFNLDRWSKLEGLATEIKFRSTVYALMTRVGQLDPGYYEGAVPRYMGEYYAEAPFIAGGSLEKSFENFRMAQKMGPKFLGNERIFVEHYLTRVEKETGQIKAPLEKLVDTELETTSPLYAENILEKNEAVRLLEKIRTGRWQ